MKGRKGREEILRTLPTVCDMTDDLLQHGQEQRGKFEDHSVFTPNHLIKYKSNHSRSASTQSWKKCVGIKFDTEKGVRKLIK